MDPLGQVGDGCGSPESGGGRLWIPWVRWRTAVEHWVRWGTAVEHRVRWVRWETAVEHLGQVGDGCGALDQVGQVGDGYGAPGSGRGQLWGRGRC